MKCAIIGADPMSAKKVEEELELLLEFKRQMLAFHETRQPLLDIKRERDEQMTAFTVFDEERFKRRGEQVMPALLQARQNVARNIQEATELVDKYGIPSQVKIFPPPAFGGLIHTLNIFEAAIEPELPHDFVLEARLVFDTIDKTIWACERRLKTAGQVDVKGGAAKVARGFLSFLGGIFKTETDRAILKWLVFVLLGGLTLRYVFGLKFESIAKLLIDRVAK